MSNSYYEEHYQKLVGATIKSIGFDAETDMYALMLEDGRRVWIMQDPEGNGPGHLDIDEGE